MVTREELSIQGERMDAASEPVNPLLVVHRALRGRYRYAIPLAVLLAVPGLIGGYKALPPKFTSNGQILISPTLPVIQYRLEENQTPPHFESFVSTQATYLRQRRVLDRAVQDEKLLEAGWPSGLRGVSALVKSIDVRVPKKVQLITLSVSDQDPRKAQQAVNAVLRAYMELYGERSGVEITTRERKLGDRINALEAQRRSLLERVLQMAGDEHPDKLELRHNEKVERSLQLERSLYDIELKIRALESKDESETQETSEDTVEGMSVERLAEIDSALGKILADRDAIEVEIETSRERFGSEYRYMKELVRRLESLNIRLERRVTWLREVVARQSETPSIVSAAGVETLDGLRSLRATYTEMALEIRAEEARLARLRQDVRLVQEESRSVQRQLDDARGTLERLRVETENLRAGRVSISSFGDLPIEPSTDRRLPLAVMGGGMGASIGIGSFALFGMLRRRYRFIDEFASIEKSAPLLAVLPDLEISSDEDGRELASLGIHHLRTLLPLQVRDGNADSMVFTVTSPSSGDGKTRLALALGMSFAGSGRKTAILDADLVGQGLSLYLGLQDNTGLSEAIKTLNLNGELYKQEENLWILPAGPGGTLDPEELSLEGMKALIEALRSQFDIVIIDTGPVLGSIEANLAIRSSDGTLLTISRGQDPRLVNAAMDRIARLGAKCAGLVFNKANIEDMSHSASHVSLSATSSRSVRSNGEERSGHRRRSLAEVFVGVPGEDAQKGQERA